MLGLRLGCIQKDMLQQITIEQTNSKGKQAWKKVGLNKKWPN
jgi:hypothetical protein